MLVVSEDSFISNQVDSIKTGIIINHHYCRPLFQGAYYRWLSVCTVALDQSMSWWCLMAWHIHSQKKNDVQGRRPPIACIQQLIFSQLVNTLPELPILWDPLPVHVLYCSHPFCMIFPVPCHPLSLIPTPTYHATPTSSLPAHYIICRGVITTEKDHCIVVETFGI